MPSDENDPTDERTRELLDERLREDPQIDPAGVQVIVHGGRITLEGTVDSPENRRAIEDAAAQFGAGEVRSNLRVQPSGERDS